MIIKGEINLKYGLMVFNKTRNIGDDIQSYVAMKYLPKIDYFIDRENLDSFTSDNNEKVAVIMNGWYMHYTLNWPPSPYIRPFPISMHLSTKDFWDIKSDQSYMKGYGLEYFKNISPIGCRDSHTLKLLSDNNVKAEFTGCLSLTLERFDNVQKGNYICAVDVSSKVIDKIKEYTNLEIKIITHEVSEDYYKLTWDERVKNVENLLKLYQGAKCVITTRLHCALPCTALNAPVLIIHDKYNDDRFKDYIEFIDYCYESDFLNGTYNYNFLNPPADKIKHFKMKESLNERCINFIQECEKNIDNKDKGLPDKNFYTNYMVPRSNWYKEIILELEEKTKLLNQIIKDYEEVSVKKDNIINELQDNIEKQNLELNKINNKLVDTDHQLQHIQNSKAWSICKKLYKIRDTITGNK